MSLGRESPIVATWCTKKMIETRVAVGAKELSVHYGASKAG
jgi:hypothetical protein